MIEATTLVRAAVTSWDDARAIARLAGERLATTHALENVRIPLADAAGRTTARDVVAGTDLPRYDASAMDGWVVAGDGPWRVGTTILAGDLPSPHPLPPGFARPIATGGLVPVGSTAVLRSEHGEVSTNASWPMLHAPAIAPGRDIRPAGEEAWRGDVLLGAGAVLTPPRLALAAVAGYSEIEVTAERGVGVIVLGDELHTGMVRDAFMPSLPAAIRAVGARVAGSMQCRDDPDSTVSAMASAPGDLLITTGGTSHGPTDFARSSLISLGARLLFDGVAVRPGHPVILAELPDGRLVLCLPGNPLAAMLCFASFAVPLLDGASRRRPAASVPVSLGAAMVNDSSSTRLVPCVLDGDVARATGWQGPGMLRGLAGADAIAVVPPGGVPAGSRAATLTLPW